MPNRIIREDRFTTQGQPEKQQFDLFREQIAPILNVSQTNGSGSAASNGGFRAEVKYYDLGKILLVNTTLGSESFERTLDHIRRSESSHWYFSVRKSGFSVSR